MAILHPGGNVIAAREPTGVSELDATLTAIVERAARLAGAEVVIARLADETGGHVAHAVHARSESVRAELEASRIDAASVPAEEEPGLEELPQALRLAAERVGAVDVVRLPVRDNGSVVGSVELMRTRTEFDEVQLALARAAADEVALARRAYAGEHGRATHDPLELAGDALAVGSAETHAADQVAHLAAEATDARACLVWQYADDEEPVLAALAGPDSAAAPAYALEVLRRAVESREPVTVEPVGEPGWLVTLRLGGAPLGGLPLPIRPGAGPRGPPPPPRLATFAVRAAHALRTSEHRRTLAADLDRTRALLTIVGQAIAELSLTHTLDTAVDRVRDLLSVERLAVYLVPAGGGSLETAAERGLTGPHHRIAERLLELALGPARGRGLLLVEDAEDARLAGSREAIEEVGIQAAIGVPLRAGEQLIGLLAVYPERGRTLTENEESLLRALVAQLAVAVQNAQLHEKVERESGEAKRARD